jgi:serine/threonine-protein kinase/endoribonuclease IRE1
VGNKLVVDLNAILGEGSMNTRVFRGRHEEWDDVAVKVMQNTQMLKHMASKEKEVLKKLMGKAGYGADFVIQYRESCNEQLEGVDYLLLCMELCQVSLHDIFTGDAQASIGKGVTCEESMRAIQQLQAGLSYLHSNGVVHMDVRPRNILFLRPSRGEGSLGTLKIADYGLSKDRIDQNAEDHSVSLSISFTFSQAQVAGAWSSWQAPEVVRQAKKTKKVDVFMSGCCIFFILTKGLHPFDELGKKNVIPAVRQSNVLNDQRLSIGALKGLQTVEKLGHVEALDLVKWMTKNDPNDRPHITAALSHPFFWDQNRRYDFLCKVGNQEEVKEGTVRKTACSMCCN